MENLHSGKRWNPPPDLSVGDNVFVLSTTDKIRRSVTERLEPEQPTTARKRISTVRRSTHTAMIPHDCDHCHHPIHPGDEYEKLTQSIDGKIVAWKTHLYPSCEPDDDPWGDEEYFESDIHSASQDSGSDKIAA